MILGVFQLCSPPLSTELFLLLKIGPLRSGGADMTSACPATLGSQGGTPGDPGHQTSSTGVLQSPCTRVLLRAQFRARVLGGGRAATPGTPRTRREFGQLLPCWSTAPTWRCALRAQRRGHHVEPPSAPHCSVAEEYSSAPVTHLSVYGHRLFPPQFPEQRCRKPLCACFHFSGIKTRERRCWVIW